MNITIRKLMRQAGVKLERVRAGMWITVFGRCLRFDSRRDALAAIRRQSELATAIDNRDDYKLLENVAAIASSVFGDSRIEAHVDSHDVPYNQRLEWCVNAAKALTAREPADPVSYDEAKLDWIDIIDAVADGFFADAEPADSVESALKSSVTTEQPASV